MKNLKLPEIHKHKHQVIYSAGYQIIAKTKPKFRKNTRKNVDRGERSSYVDCGQQAAGNSSVVTRQTISPFGLFINNLD